MVSAVQAKNQRLLLLILGDVLFPVSSAIQVHDASKQGGSTPITATTSTPSHFLQQQYGKVVPLTQCTFHAFVEGPTPTLSLD